MTFRRKLSANFTATGKKTGKDEAAREIIVVWTAEPTSKMNKILQTYQDSRLNRGFRESFELGIPLEAIQNSCKIHDTESKRFYIASLRHSCTLRVAKAAVARNFDFTEARFDMQRSGYPKLELQGRNNAFGK